jgi:hypothetical protein
MTTLRSTTLLLAATIATLGATNAAALRIPPADMTTWQLQTPASDQRFDTAVFVTLNDAAFTSSVVVADPSVMYPVEYIMGDLNERYARAVASAVFGNATVAGAEGAPPDGVATLRLSSINLLHRVGKGFATRDITDYVQATWSLSDLTGREIYRFTFAGTATSNSGAGKAYGPKGRERTGLAYQDLLENTVRGFAASTAMRRFALIPELYLHSERRLAEGERRLQTALERDRILVLEAMLWFAVEQSADDVYAFAHEQVETAGIVALQDESVLLHTAVQSSSDALFESVAASSRDLEIREGGRTPLYRAMFLERSDRALKLISLGARPIIDAPDSVYIAAEANYKIATLLGSEPAKASEAFAAARAGYESAIVEAQSSIQGNEAAIWANKVARILAPAIQMGQAQIIAGAEARAMAAQTGFVGFATSVYTPAQYDSSTPREAIAALNQLIEHCRSRLAEIEQNTGGSATPR